MISEALLWLMEIAGIDWAGLVQPCFMGTLQEDCQFLTAQHPSVIKSWMSDGFLNQEIP
jgi:hypothetical protein